jgi:uncharacterized membrane protein
MDKIITFLNNSWVSSIITGLLVYYVTEIFKAFREKKSYMEKVFQANREMFHTIKFSIPEATLPNPEILRAIHKSTAKRYGVDLVDMESVPVVLEDLVKEIMDSNFLPHDTKLDYSGQLLELRQQVLKLPEEAKSIPVSSESRSKQISASAIIAVIGSLIAFTVNTIDKLSFSEVLNKLQSLPSFITVGTSLVATMMLVIMTKVEIQNLKRRYEKKVNNRLKTKRLDNK